VPHAATHTDCVAGEAEKRKRFRKKHQEVQEAAVDTPNITAAVVGVAMSVCVICCPLVIHYS